MKIKWQTLWIAQDDQLQFATGFTLNGRQIVQEAQFMRAAVAAFYARKNRSVELSFQVSRAFATNSLAEQFFIGHYDTLEDGPGTLTCRCGDGGEPITDVLVQNAVLSDVSFPTIRGVSVDVRYTFKAPKISAVYSPPADTDVRTGTLAIPNGVDNVTFSGLAFPSTPARVSGSVRMPAGADLIFANIVDGTVTSDGFKINLSGATPNANYKYDYVATL